MLQEVVEYQQAEDPDVYADEVAMLHANYKPGSPARGFSISMPNTFSMSPA